jgi:hypothetical protein
MRSLSRRSREAAKADCQIQLLAIQILTLLRSPFDPPAPQPEVERFSGASSKICNKTECSQRPLSKSPLTEARPGRRSLPPACHHVVANVQPIGPRCRPAVDWRRDEPARSSIRRCGSGSRVCVGLEPGAAAARQCVTRGGGAMNTPAQRTPGDHERKGALCESSDR